MNDYVYPAPSGSPTRVTALALSSTSILITWGRPNEFDINGILLNFHLTVTDSVAYKREYVLPATSYSFHLEGEIIIMIAYY